MRALRPAAAAGLREEPWPSSGRKLRPIGAACCRAAEAAPSFGGFNLWGVAAAVSNSVKARADELVKSVQETDWKAEIMAFSKVGAVHGGQRRAQRAARGETCCMRPDRTNPPPAHAACPLAGLTHCTPPQEVKDDTDKVKARTAELVENLPEAMEQLPEKVRAVKGGGLCAC